MKPSNEKFDHAYNLISQQLPETPLVKNEWLSKKYNCNVFLKLENLQPIGSFKLRGATYKLSQLSKEELSSGVVAVSAGNHAQGVAWAANKFKSQATIIMPKPSPITKIIKTESLGAEVILEGENVDESFDFAHSYLEQNQKVFIHPFADEDVIAGQGSIAYELKNQIDKIDYLFGSIGGGGLMAGMGIKVKDFFPSCRLIGSQARGANSMVQSLETGKIINLESSITFADGIKVRKPHEDMYELLDGVIDDAISVDDDKIAEAVLELIEQARVITEGAGAINLAAFDELYNKSPRRFKDKNVVIVLCGGNIDVNLIDKIIIKGLVRSERQIKLSVILEDIPGALSRLTQEFSNLGANILEIHHDRNDPTLEMHQTVVRTTLETKGPIHSRDILKGLKENYEVRKK